MKKKRAAPGAILIILGAVLVGLIVLSSLMGRYPVPPKELACILLHKVFPGTKVFWDQTMEAVVFNIRLPRILLSCLVGCCLAVAGGAYQGVFQNPMASPDLLGATSGAAMGAAVAILLGASSRMVTVSAFLCSLLSIVMAWGISRAAKGKRVLTLVLAGIMVSSLFNAAVSYCKLVADPTNQLPEITYWLMGSLSGAQKSDVAFAIWPMALGLIPLFFLRWRMNVLTLGDDEARAIGVNAGRMRIVVICCSTLITAATVAVSGMIGWVGLVVPHMARRLVGNNYVYMLPASMLFGAAFLLAVDNVSRNLMATEIPLGILTAVVGVPFFIWLITRKGDAF